MDGDLLIFNIDNVEHERYSDYILELLQHPCKLLALRKAPVSLRNMRLVSSQHLGVLDTFQCVAQAKSGKLLIFGSRFIDVLLAKHARRNNIEVIFIQHAINYTPTYVKRGFTLRKIRSKAWLYTYGLLIYILFGLKRRSWETSGSDVIAVYFSASFAGRIEWKNRCRSHLRNGVARPVSVRCKNGGEDSGSSQRRLH